MQRKDLKYLSTKKVSSFIKQQQKQLDPFEYDFKYSNKLKDQMKRQLRTLYQLYERQDDAETRQLIAQSIEFLLILQQKFMLQRIKKQQQQQDIKRQQNMFDDDVLEDILHEAQQQISDDDGEDTQYEDSMRVFDISSSISSNNFISLSDKNKYISALWQKHQQVSGKSVGKRSSNNNQYHIEQYFNQGYQVYIPSQGNCFMKCLEMFINLNKNDDQSYEDKQKIIIDLMINKYQNQFKHGISSKTACQILRQHFANDPINYININQYQHNNLSFNQYYITSFQNHYCLVKYFDQQYIDEQLNIIRKRLSQNFIEENMNTINQDDINQMINISQVQQKQSQNQRQEYCYLFISDIESYQNNRADQQTPYMNGFISRKIGYDIKSEQITQMITNKQCKINFDKDPSLLMNTMIDQMFKLMIKDKIYQGYLVFHNGKRYDNIILLQYLNSKKYDIAKITKKGQSISFTIKYRSYYIQLFDSTDLMKASLKKISKDFKLINKKIKCDEIAHIHTYQDFIDNKQKIIEYFIMDLASLFEFFVNFRNSALELFQLDLLNYQTIGQLAISKYIQSYNTEYKNQQWFFNNIQQNNFLRNFYRGGRTCAFRRQSKQGQKLFYVDMNSLYPSSMIQLENMLDGKIFILDNNALVLNQQQKQLLQDRYNNYNNKQFNYIKEAFIITCDIYIPCQKNVIVNNIKYEQDGQQKTGYVTGSFQQTHWFSWDLIQSIKYNNLQIKYIHQAIQLKSRVQSNLSQYINQLYQLRLEQKKLGNECNQLFLKCISNSLYGKTVQKPIYEKIKPIDKETNKIYQRYDVQKVFKYQDFTFFQYYDNTLKSQMNCSNISFAYQILAMSKIMINNLMEQCNCIIYDNKTNGDNLCYYTDTDSIIIQEHQYNTLVEKGLIGDNMGQAKLEHEIFNYFSAGKKMYAFDYIEDEKLVSKYILKGVSGQTEQQYQHIFQQLKDDQITSTKFTQFLIKLGKTTGIQVDDQMEKIIKNTYNNDRYLTSGFYFSLHISTISGDEINVTI